MSKYYSELDEYKSENNKLKTKVKKLETDLRLAKELINKTHEINIELNAKVETLEKRVNYGKQNINTEM